jgi:hypothetical protein
LFIVSVSHSTTHAVVFRFPTKIHERMTLMIIYDCFVKAWKTLVILREEGPETVRQGCCNYALTVMAVVGDEQLRFSQFLFCAAAAQ